MRAWAFPYFIRRQQHSHMSDGGIICPHAFRRFGLNAHLLWFNAKQFGHAGLDLAFGIALANVWTIAPALAVGLAVAPVAALGVHRLTARHPAPVPVSA